MGRGRAAPAALGAALAFALAGCSDDPGGPDQGVDVQFDAAAEAVDGRGIGVRIAVRDTADRLREASVVVTGEDGAVVDRPSTAQAYGDYSRFRDWSTVAYLPGPGRYTVTVTAATARGRSHTVAVTRTLRLDDEPYGVAVLPDRGADAGVHWVDPRGAVAGWVGTAAGGRRPAVWRDGALAEVPTTDSVSAEAVRVNTAGDVLLQLEPYRAVNAHQAVRVRTAEGREVVLGPLTTRLGDGRVVPACCTLAADLSEGRRAVGAPVQDFGSGVSSVVLDAGSGRADSVPGIYRTVNARGQAAGVAMTGVVGYPSTYVVPVGFTMAPLPEASVRQRCDVPAGRFTVTRPIDLDDDGNLLVEHCGTPAYLSAGGTSRWLDRAVGGGVRRVRLSRQGGIVAALDTSGALWLWRAATGRTTRVRLADAGWRVDALGTVNAGGLIAAHGVHAATGRRAALLLTPAR